MRYILILCVFLTSCIDPYTTDPNPVRSWAHEYKPMGTCDSISPWGITKPLDRYYCYSDTETYWHEKCHVLNAINGMSFKNNSHSCGDK